ncbi:hypothetical protein V496_01598 [Pseudogymnoascus sp. VKM F-4515 (FW-2607)]|nr:hypothetical protein V496_01598 [Pseudogymnoascus sp. VKM F-4515 (FW-2607)]
MQRRRRVRPNHNLALSRVGRDGRLRDRRLPVASTFKGDDETSLGFPQFCATCEKQLATSSASQLFCSDACRLCDSKLEAKGTNKVRLTGNILLGKKSLKIRINNQ